MPELPGPASWQQAMSHLQSFIDHQLPDLLEDHYGEWAVLDATSGELIGVHPAPKAVALARTRPRGEVLLEQVCKPVPMVVGGGVQLSDNATTPRGWPWIGGGGLTNGQPATSHQ